MTFTDLAVTLNLPAGSLRVIFSRHRWSIHRPEDVRKFLKTRFSDQKIQRVKQPWRSVTHLKKWQFRKNLGLKTQNAGEETVIEAKIRTLEAKLAKPGEAQRRLAPPNPAS